MAKRTKSELKNYFQAGKRPTENQFGDFIDSYVHIDASDNYREKNDLKFTFPNQQPNQAIDILLGNKAISGWLELELAGFHNYQNSVGILKKQFVIGAFPDNSVWYPSVSRIIEASGEIADNIYIGDIVWDDTISQYKITVYHTNFNGNNYSLRLVHHSTENSIAHQVVLSSVYTKQLIGQSKHFVNYNENVGIGTKLPYSKLHVISPFSTAQEPGAFIIGDLNYPNLRIGHNDQHTWIQSHSGAPLQINSLGNNVVFNKNAGNVGIGIENPQTKLDVNGFITSKITNEAVNSSNTSGFSVNQLGTNVFEMSFTRDGKGVGMIKTLSDNHIAIATNNTERIRVHSTSGNVGIGTKNPDQKLTVKGKIHAEDIIIDLNVPADYVFHKYYDNYSSIREDYSMMNLNELESFIKENKHLPEIPSVDRMTQDGLALGDFQMKLLQKIEELTLYAISQNKEIEKLKSQINKQ
ncbi:MAG: hypothetical protein J6O88_05160 [Chryseobacterium sp.]|uniref:hypothetical protein n=1 Tax=Chryseobacterium sp. TaxID=1871047 RepID=UPI001B2A77AB|nr:hypothetical protein [Chryseobacterium sp.]MBO6184072.1 hypothetical protein [Chryseobacterium sp.]